MERNLEQERYDYYLSLLPVHKRIKHEVRRYLLVFYFWWTLRGYNDAESKEAELSKRKLATATILLVLVTMFSIAWVTDHKPLAVILFIGFGIIIGGLFIFWLMADLIEHNSGNNNE